MRSLQNHSAFGEVPKKANSIWYRVYGMDGIEYMVYGIEYGIWYRVWYRRYRVYGMHGIWYMVLDGL